MNQTAIRNALILRLEAANLGYSIYSENTISNPKGSAPFLAVYFLPSLEESCGKTVSSSDLQRGIFQITIFVNASDNDATLKQIEIVDQLKLLFHSSLVFDGVEIEGVEVGSGRDGDGGYFARDLSINYNGITSRN